MILVRTRNSLKRFAKTYLIDSFFPRRRTTCINRTIVIRSGCETTGVNHDRFQRRDFTAAAQRL